MGVENRHNTKTRTAYIDFVRIIAAFFVIFNHTNENGFFLFAEREWGSIAFWAYMFFSIFCKVSVPLFLAISGALMLHRENEPLLVLWRKKIGKILLILVLFIVGNYLYDWVRFQKAPDLIEIFKTIYTGSSAGQSFWYGHLWYLYAYMAYLCCVPFLRSLVKNLEDKYFYYMIALALIFDGILPAAEYFLSDGYVPLSGDAIPKWLLADIVLYPCIGYFLAHRCSVKSRGILLLWLGNFTTIAVTGLLIYRQTVITQVLNESVSQGFHSIFVLVNCICIFTTVRYCFETFRISEKLDAAVRSVGQCTFGIYLFHIMILQSAISQRFLEFLVMRINSMVACFVQCACVFLVGYGITWLSRKIPYIGKLL